jgi:hypothetical protein
MIPESVMGWLNALSCLVLMGYAFFGCYVMPHRGMWSKRILIWCVVALLGVHIASPWARTLDPITWYGAALHALMAASFLVWHKHVMRFVVIQFLAVQNLETGPVPLDDSPTAFDYVHGIYVKNRRRFLRRVRDRSKSQPPADAGS